MQRTGIRTTRAYVSPTPRPKKGSIKMLEPTYVLTYTTDQTNRLVRDDSFINVIYQQTLDVLDAPFRIRPSVTIPVGSYQMSEWIFTCNTSPGRRLYERLTVSPVDFYGGSRLNLSAAAGVRVSSRLSAEGQYNRNDVQMPWGA